MILPGDESLLDFRKTNGRGVFRPSIPQFSKSFRRGAPWKFASLLPAARTNLKHLEIVAKSFQRIAGTLT